MHVFEQEPKQLSHLSSADEKENQINSEFHSLLFYFFKFCVKERGRYWNSITGVVFGAKIYTQGRSTTKLTEEMGVFQSVYSKGTFLCTLQWAIKQTFVGNHTCLQAIPVALPETERGSRLPKKISQNQTYPHKRSSSSVLHSLSFSLSIQIWLAKWDSYWDLY